MLVDASHKVQLLIVQNEDQIKANCLDLQDEVDTEQLEALKSGRQIYYNPHFWDDSPRSSHDELIPAEVLVDGPNRFFYGITSNVEGFEQDRMAFLA